MLAEDSAKLCDTINTDGRDCADEMATIDLQLDAAYAMQDYLDAQAGGPGQGWYRIVTTPAEARLVIQAGKLAVVLGIETAYLFNCRDETSCHWEANLEKYWRKGVRHFFPIHQANNAFGGASYFQPYIQKQENWVGDDINPLYWVSEPYVLVTRPCPQYKQGRGRCNAEGLTWMGQELIRALMAKGALIDIDHMSDRAVDDMLTLAEHEDYPVVASHAGFNEINAGDQDHEGQLTLAELQRIYQLGGMVGLISGQGNIDEVNTYERGPEKHTVSHICGRTTETFAQAYYYAIDHAPGMPIAIGTDFNSPLALPGPRFGPGQCAGNSDQWVFVPDARRFPPDKWNEELSYPFFARGSDVLLDRFQSANRLFDFNTDGLAHVGLLPDFFADLEVLGIPSEDLAPLFHSAEGYITVWEKASALAHDRIGVLKQDGNVYVKVGPLNALWTWESSDVQSLALAGNRIGVLKQDGNVYVKEGPLNAAWTWESADVQSLVLAGDRIGVLKQDGNVYVKEGPLNAAWTWESADVQSLDLSSSHRLMIPSPQLPHPPADRVCMKKPWTPGCEP
jgi:microsomal dipeptidase-like Zn-dependent dipeptidase